MTILPHVVERQVEDAGFLWIWRTGLAAAPHVRLNRLVTGDERLAAHLDAVRIAGVPAIEAARAELAGGHQGAYFLAAWIAVQNRDIGRLLTLADAAAGQEESAPFLAAVVAAIAWVGADAAAHGADALMTEGAVLPRVLGLRAAAARRADPGELLPQALEDPAPPVRAAAARAAGLLGRTVLRPMLAALIEDPDPDCRFWAAWAATRLGGEAAIATLADIAWNNLPHAGRALDLLLRRLDPAAARDWLKQLATLEDRRRDLIRATGVLGDPHYVPWLIEQMRPDPSARLAGEAFAMITGLDLSYRDLDRKPPAGIEYGPNDDPADANVALDEDENLPFPDADKIAAWWAAHRHGFPPGTPHFLGAPKASADWLQALSDGYQRQRRAAALELALRHPGRAMFETRARGRMQRQMLTRAANPSRSRWAE